MKTATPTANDLTGMLSWSDGKSIAMNAIVDQVAVSGVTLHYLSFVASVAELKAIRAGLNTEAKIPVKLTGIVLKRGDEFVTVNDTYPSEWGYKILAHRLPHGTVHAIAINRQPGFLLDDSEETLWVELRKDRFTTPLLKSWSSYLKQELIDRELLFPCDNYRCSCWMLSAKDSDLDDIVSSGLKSGLIEIKE